MDPCDHCEEVMQPFLDRSLSLEEQSRSRRTSRRARGARKRFRFEQELRGYVRVACTEEMPPEPQGQARGAPDAAAVAPPMRGRGAARRSRRAVAVVAARQRARPDAELAREPRRDVVAAALVVHGRLRVVEPVRATDARDVVPERTDARRDLTREHDVAVAVEHVDVDLPRLGQRGLGGESGRPALRARAAPRDRG